jgi:radical SAM superfamily enzyme YgiQ (UPF0313 family)
MRIAFVSANRESLPDPVIPLGLLYLVRVTPPEHERCLIDLCFEPDPHGHLARELAAFQPDLVAVGLRNIQNSDYSGTADNVDYYAALMKTVRETTSAPVVIGGGGFTVLPRGLMERLRPEYGIAGEAEVAFAQLLRALPGGVTDLARVGGLLWWRRGALVVNPPQPTFQDLDALGAPERGLVDPRHYREVGIEPVQTKRGCALRCDYCTYPAIEGRTVRARAPRLVVDELLGCLRQHPELEHFFFVDAVFNHPPRHAKAVCREMVARGLSTPWTCYANPAGFDAELAALMAEARCAGLEVGADSGCDEVLRALDKGFDTRSIRAMSELCREHGLRDCHTFLLGTRTETLDQVRRTLDFVHDLEPFAAILMLWTDDDEALDPALRAERAAFRAQISALLHEAGPDHPRWIIPSLAVNFDPRLMRALRRQGLRGPLWQHLEMVGK